MSEEKSQGLKADPRALEAIARFESRNKQKPGPVRNQKMRGHLPPASASSAESWQLFSPWPMFARDTTRRASVTHCCLAGVLLFLALWIFWQHPLKGFALALLLAIYGLCLWLRPVSVLLLLPAMISVLDLSPWSGWWFFDELDSVMLLTLAVLLVRAPLSGAAWRFSRPLGLVLLLTTVSYAISLLIPLLPWPETDLNSFTSYLSPFNALRVGRGFFWILFLLPWMQQFSSRGVPVLGYLAAGFVFAAALVGLYVLYERWRLVGLLNLTSFYRSVGPFYSMHTGDGHIDVFLAAMLPLILVIALAKPRQITMALALLATLVGIYCLITTGSRGPALAALAGYTIAFIAYLAASQKITTRLAAVLAATALAGFASTFLLTPLLKDTYLGQRFATTRADAQERNAHWRKSLSLRDGRISSSLFGMGLGTFPKLYDQRSLTEGKPVARFDFMREAGNNFLRLTPGDHVHLQQLIKVDPNSSYRLSFRTRHEKADAVLNLAICDKWIMHLRHTVDCRNNYVAFGPPNRPWHAHEVIATTGSMGQPHWRWGKAGARPIWLMIYFEGTQPIDLDDIQLRTSDGRNLVRNGDFEQAQNYWFWVTYNHLTHHSKNLAVNILIDQGWFGLICFVTAVLLSVGALIKRLKQGERIAIAWLGAITGLIVIGVTVSSFDAPRLTMLSYLLILAPLIQPRLASGR